MPSIPGKKDIAIECSLSVQPLMNDIGKRVLSRPLLRKVLLNRGQPLTLIADRQDKLASRISPVELGIQKRNRQIAKRIISLKCRRIPRRVVDLPPDRPGVLRRIPMKTLV